MIPYITNIFVSCWIGRQITNLSYSRSKIIFSFYLTVRSRNSCTDRISNPIFSWYFLVFSFFAISIHFVWITDKTSLNDINLRMMMLWDEAYLCFIAMMKSNEREDSILWMTRTSPISKYFEGFRPGMICWSSQVLSFRCKELPGEKVNPILYTGTIWNLILDRQAL